MGGGVSLGSFSGGALGEVVRLLREKLNANEFAQVEFDVFAGASAGALSLALMLKTLADPATSGKADSVLDAEWRAWVKLIDIEKLIPDPKMQDVASFLRRDAVDDIARQLVSWKSGTPVATNGVLADQVLFACTLSNLNGIPIDLRNKQQGLAFYDGLQTTLYRDIRIFALDFNRTAQESQFPKAWVFRNDLDKPEAWSEIAATSIACGAFPFAFEPVVVQRAKSEYGKLWPWMEAVGGAQSSKDSFPFTFSDGGMFNNEPLREAMQLINYRDANASNIDRLLIFIDPNFSGTPFSFVLDYHRDLYVEPQDKTIPWFSSLFDGKDVRPRPFAQRMLAMLGTVIGAVTSQASFKDWLQADKINNQISWREATLNVIKDVILSVVPEKLAGLVQGAKTALQAILDEKRQVSTLPSDKLTVGDEKGRVEREEKELLSGITGSEHLELLIYLAAMIDQLGGLRSKQQIQMLGIGPVASNGKERFDLAGDFISSFGGFFEQAYRQYDYDVGVAMAGRALSTFKFKRDNSEISLLDSGAVIKPIPKTTAEVFGADPSADSAPRSKLFFQRAAYVAGEILDGFLDFPFRLEKTLKPLIGTFSGFLGTIGISAGYRAALVRINIKRQTPEERFFLVGKNGGDDLEISGNSMNSSITTVVFYWTEAISPNGPSIKGPHVRNNGANNYMEIRRGRYFFTESKQLELPKLSAFVRTEKFGLAALTIEVIWPSIPDVSQWTLIEQLRPLTDKIK